MISIFSCTDAEENPQAFLCRLYERYARLMYSVASKHLPGAPHAREDVVQETLLKLTQKVPLLQTMEEAPLAAYICVAVRNTAFGTSGRNCLKKTVSFWRGVTSCAIPTRSWPPGSTAKAPAYA